jgi:hypothetical protein
MGGMTNQEDGIREPPSCLHLHQLYLVASVFAAHACGLGKKISSPIRFVAADGAFLPFLPLTLVAMVVAAQDDDVSQQMKTRPSAAGPHLARRKGKDRALVDFATICNAIREEYRRGQ